MAEKAHLLMTGMLIPVIISFAFIVWGVKAIKASSHERGWYYVPAGAGMILFGVAIIIIFYLNTKNRIC